MRFFYCLIASLLVVSCSGGNQNETPEPTYGYSGMQGEYCRGFVGGFRLVAGFDETVPRCPIMAGLPEGMTPFDAGAAVGMATGCDLTYSLQEWTRVRHHCVEEGREVRS